jgi:protocatechuate 3,4-dioxygenase beta subunit
LEEYPVFRIQLARSETDSGNHFLEVLPSSIRGVVRRNNTEDGSVSVPEPFVFLELLHDPNANGLPDDASSVYRYNRGESEAYVVMTDENGFYDFDNLLPGSYLVRLLAPDAHAVVGGSDSTEDNPLLPQDPANAHHNDGLIAVRLASGEMDDGNSFRIVLEATVRGGVLLDEDDNGIGDSPMAEVLLELRTLADGPVDDPNQPGFQRYVTQTSSLQGIFEFTKLIPGAYRVFQLQPQGFTSTADEDTSADSPTSPEDAPNTDPRDNIIPTHLAVGETDDGHWFVEERVVGMAVGNLVFSDINGDGVYNPSGEDQNFASLYDNDTGLPGVQVQLWRSVDDIFGNEDDVRIKTGADGVEGTADDLTSATETDPAGRYLFSGLMTQGRYYVKIPATELGEGLLGKVSSPGQQLDQTQDDDAGENGNDDPTNGFISSMFDLTFNAMPSGETGKPSPQPDDNSTNLTIDFGFFGPAGITGRVWNDLDNNNTPDDPIGGVVLTLLNQFREPVRNPNLPDFQAYEVTTDEDGRYTFTNLPPARYLVVQKQPDGYLSVSAEDVTEDLLTSPPDMTDQDSGYDEIAVTLAPSETDSGNDFTEELGVSISGKVEFDGEGDGSPDQAMVGALIYVTDAQGTQIYNHQGESTEPVSAVSREDGTYDMPLLAPGIYGLRLVPQQFQVGLTDSDGGDPLRYTPRMFSNFSDNTGINFVLTKALAIGNLVFIDLDTDGKYTAGSDHPVAEITVLCFRDENEDGVLTGPQEQTPISLAQTNENGRYLIDNLRAGHYILQIPPGAFSTGSLASLRPAPIAENSGGSDDETSHDALPAESPELTGVYTRPIALTVGAAPLDEATDDGQGQDALRDSDVDLTVDFAFVGSLAIYGFVYQDADQSGDYSSGDDALAASQINLWLDSNNNFTLDSLDYQIGSRFTDALGSYGFESLMPGRYFVQSATLPGATRITNSQGNTGVVSVQLARESSYDNWFLDRIVPTGHLYSSRTGAIIPGGRVYSRNQSGNSHLDGNSGRYFMSPTQGSTEMTLFIVPPPGWKVDPNGWAGESPFQAPAVSGGHVLGSAESTTTPGFLNSLEQQNPYYESFIITEGPQPYGYNAVVYNNIPLVEIIPSTFAEWLHQRGSSSEEAYDDFNRNGFNNILEFAFGLPADSQVIPHAPIRINADPHTGKVLVCHLALQQSEGVQYFLEVSQDLFKNPVWHRIETLTPSAIYNPDGTQYVCYSGIEDVFAWLAEGRGFVRVVVGVDMDLDGSIDFTTASSVSGWQSHSHAVAASPEVTSQTTTFANPFIKFTAWQGSLTGANPTQIFTQGKVDGAMRTDSCYVLEILNGPLGGHRFGLDPVGSADTTLRLVPGSPFTTTVPLDGLLGGADAVIRELWRINDVLPPTRFMADGDPDAGDNALLFENGQWRSFYAVSTNEGTVWADATTALPTDSGANKYLDPAQALFVVRRGGALSTVIAGQVRTTPFAMPLKLGYNLVGAVFPGVQTISDRGMDNTDVFRGHAESTRADQILLWRGDFAPGKNGYQSYFFLDLEQPFQFWTGISDVHLHSVNYDELFGPTSAAFYLSRREHSDWIIRPPRGRGGEQ